MINDIFMRAEEIQQLNDSPLRMGVSKLERWIIQSPLTQLWCKLSTDGAINRSGETSVDGLIRDNNRKWIAGFGMRIGVCSVMVAELQGLYQGLSIAWQKGDCWLIVAIDGLCVIHLIANFLVLANEHTSLGRFVEELLKRDWNITINHMYCEANFAANFLGNYALSLPLGCHLFNDPPTRVLIFVTYDIYDMYEVVYSHFMLP